MTPCKRPDQGKILDAPKPRGTARRSGALWVGKPCIQSLRPGHADCRVTRSAKKHELPNPLYDVVVGLKCLLILTLVSHEEYSIDLRLKHSLSHNPELRNTSINDIGSDYDPEPVTEPAPNHRASLESILVSINTSFKHAHVS